MHRGANLGLVKNLLQWLVGRLSLAHKQAASLLLKTKAYYQVHKPHHLEIKIKITWVKVMLIGIVGWNIWPHHSTTIAAPEQTPQVVYAKKLSEPKLSPQKPLVKKTVKHTIPTHNAYPAASYKGTGDYYLDWIVQHESGGNQFAINPSSGSCGLFQALPCSKLGCLLSDVACQINWGRNYAIQRYGSTYQAYLSWQRQGWW